MSDDCKRAFYCLEDQSQVGCEIICKEGEELIVDPRLIIFSLKISTTNNTQIWSMDVPPKIRSNASVVSRRIQHRVLVFRF